MPHFVWLTERLPGRRGGEGRTEAEEKALNDSLGIHKFLPSLLSSCVLSLPSPCPCAPMLKSLLCLVGTETRASCMIGRRLNRGDNPFFRNIWFSSLSYRCWPGQLNYPMSPYQSLFSS